MGRGGLEPGVAVDRLDLVEHQLWTDAGQRLEQAARRAVDGDPVDLMTARLQRRCDRSRGELNPLDRRAIQPFGAAQTPIIVEGEGDAQHHGGAVLASSERLGDGQKLGGSRASCYLGTEVEKTSPCLAC